MTTIDKLGREVGTGTGKPWRSGEILRLLDMVERGVSLKEMAGRLGCKKQRVKDKLKKLGVSSSEETEYSQRICLGCDCPFLSEGIHNRLCSTCRNRSVCDGRV